MRGEGIDIIEIGKSRIGQRYHLGADVPLNNPNWNGPWDCAEFASWCAWQAYGLVFGAGRPKKIQNAEPYSGHWFDEAQDPDILVTVATALATPGALLIRRPRKELIGHVAISMGDGKRTLEARSKVHGVGIFSNAAGRPWDIGAFLPGVDYGEGAFVPSGDTPLPKSQSLAPGYLALAKPRMKGPAIAALQRVLTVKGVNPGPVDGVFGEMTHSAVISFQIERGLEVDGIVGPSTADALGLSMPITPLAEDIALFAQASGGHPGPKLPPSPGATVDLVTGIALQAGFYVATTASGVSFRFGKAVPYTDDMHRVGLNQSGKALTDVAKFGKYQVSDFPGAQSQWAHFILPTLTAEGDALYATLNSYDRAAFTFGAPQLAAHMANRNFGVYLRKLLRLENASQHFPELSLRQVGGEERVHLKLASGAFRNLEEPVSIIRPNGKKEEQAVHLMAYLNSDRSSSRSI